MGFGGGSKDDNTPKYRKVTVKGSTQQPDPISQSANKVTRQQQPGLLKTADNTARTS